jgi:integrase
MLTAKKIRNAKARETPYKLADGGGLTLLVKPNGAKLWRFRYRFQGREKMLSVGSYPDTDLALARDNREEARKLLSRGIDPSAKRTEVKAAKGNRFEDVAREWMKKQKLAEVTITKANWIFETFVYPSIGQRPIAGVTASEILRALRIIESQGFHETAHRARQRISQVLRYATATGRADRDVTHDLRGALSPVPTKHRAAIVDPKKVGELLRAIDGYEGQPSVAYALRLAPLLFVRPGELRAAEWTEFDVDAKEPVWRIPAQKMKTRVQHIVPLATQAIGLLRELRPLTGYSAYLFPSLRTADRCLSDAAIGAALRRLGFSKEEASPHGFRTTASTLLNELGYNADVIERQLAHIPSDKVRSAYNRAERLTERRNLMQGWADYLDGLKADQNGKVQSLGQRPIVTQVGN